jgi:acetyl esterase/lipase
MTMSNFRKLLFTILFSAGLVAGVVAYSGNQQAEIDIKTFTYKEVGNLEIKADLLQTSHEGPCPVVVWIHGGALINGGRQDIVKQAKEMLLGAGYSIVSIDYRLAPETKLPEIIADLEDAFAWIRDQGPALFNARVERLAVMGSSAGGYLTLMSGFRVKPRPTVLVSLWGYGDLIGDWYSQPSPHPRHHGKTMTEVEIRNMIEAPPLANARDRVGDGGAFYQYCRQKGLWAMMVSGLDPRTQAGKFIPFMPIYNVSSGYPPTLLIHGTDDTDVPYEQSSLMAQQFEEHGVPFELHTVAGAEHGLAGVDPKDVDQAYKSALRFLNKYMQETGAR